MKTAELHRAIRAEGGTRGWFAHCPVCEWNGQVRATEASAEKDRDDHENDCEELEKANA